VSDHSGHDAVSDALAVVARLGAEAAELAQAAQPGTALVPAGGDMAAEQVKGSMAAVRHEVAAKVRDLEAAQRQARDAIAAQRRALDDQLAQMSAVLGPLRQQAARLQEGIWSINLYLGVGEGLVTLADGAPAPAGTQICVRQGVLAMDEECAVAAESGGIDHLRIDEFDAWITADPARVTQLLPEPRGVVAIMPRRSGKDYGDATSSAVNNELNHQTYLLIRNGGCLYRYIADGFDAGPRLTPLRDEFTGLFVSRRYNPATREFEPVPLEPGTRDWERAEAAAGARERHYFRVALILQGLVDRTACFHPLPAPGLSLLHPRAYEDGHVVLTCDDEMVLTTGRKPFRNWLRERNAQLRPGMRIVGAFNSRGWADSNECYDGSSSRPRCDVHSRVWPRSASHPQTGRIHTLDRRDGRYLVFLYERTDEVWRRNVPVPGEPGYVYTGLHPVTPQQRASARISTDDPFVIPLDLVTIEECEAYLQSRADRHAYIDMFPVLKAAIAAKRAEAEAEAPMRQLLAGHIAREHGVDVSEAAAAVPALVDWWKLANRWHRPLVTGQDPKAESRAIVAITREFAARRAAGPADDEPDIAGRLRAHVPGAMLVARKRDGSWLVLESQPRSIAGEPGDVWLREHTWSRTLTAHRARNWMLPEPSQVARWRILWSSPAWGRRNASAAAAGHLTDPEIGDIVSTALEAARQQATDPGGGAQPDARLGGRAAAVIARPSGEATDRRFIVYWVCGSRVIEHDRGACGAEMTVRWRRSTRGRIVAEHGRLRPRSWTSSPWTDRGNLVWQDGAAAAQLEEALRAYHDAEKARRRLLRQASELCEAIARQWSDDAREAARRRFIADYRDESLWPDHSAGLRFDCPHTGRHQASPPWERAVERLLGDGTDLAGLTVAEMAAMHASRFGQAITVPDDIAGYQFPGPGRAAGESGAPA
jgi:hypothetical protein